MKKPALVVVGTGIRVIGQLTTEAIAWIEIADKVLYLTHDTVACGIIANLNPSAESLAGFYGEGKLRKKSYDEMVARIMACVRSCKSTCVVFYGHPGVFCWPGQEAIRQARREGYNAKMLPAISAEDCLFADLGLDPATAGCQSYQATDFLNNNRQVDPYSLLILWQIEVVGIPVFRSERGKLPDLPLLKERLCQIYGPNREAILYIAPIQLFGEPIIQRLPLKRLTKSRFYSSSTLCIPPSQSST